MGYAAEVNVFALKATGNLELIVRKLVFEMAASVVMMSPVDEGRFRANWQYGFNTEPSGELEEKDSSGFVGGATADRLQKQIFASPAFGVHNIVNNMPYGEVLEYGLYPDPPKKGKGKTVGGYSKQAPAGMVRITFMRWEEWLTQAVTQVQQS